MNVHDGSVPECLELMSLTMPRYTPGSLDYLELIPLIAQEHVRVCKRPPPPVAVLANDKELLVFPRIEDALGHADTKHALVSILKEAQASINATEFLLLLRVWFEAIVDDEHEDLLENKAALLIIKQNVLGSTVDAIELLQDDQGFSLGKSLDVGDITANKFEGIIPPQLTGVALN